jgi:hypothetical protein
MDLTMNALKFRCDVGGLVRVSLTLVAAACRPSPALCRFGFGPGGAVMRSSHITDDSRMMRPMTIENCS